MKQLFTFIFLTNSLFLSAQNIQKSSLGMSGTSKEFVSNNTDYYISQSIGQKSLIGTYTNLRQGFQQPYINAKIVASELQVTIYPNPTDQMINISLGDTEKSVLFLTLYDTYGKLIINKKIDYSSSTQLDISSLSSGLYLLKLFNGNQSFVAQIIKQ